MGHPLKFQDIADAVKRMPNMKDWLGKDSDEIPSVPKMDMVTTDEALGIMWRTKKQTFVDTANALLEIEKRLCDSKLKGRGERVPSYRGWPIEGTDSRNDR